MDAGGTTEGAMTTLGLHHVRTRPMVQSVRSEVKLRAALLVCGILSSLLYAVMLVVVPMQWEGYSSVSQTVSELSALDAPTRPLWVWLGSFYTLLVALFGCGVLGSAGRGRGLRVVGYALVAYGAIGLFWPPIHQRGVQPTLTDTMHIIFTMGTIVLMMLAMGFGAAAFGRRFHLYSIASMVVLVGFGVLAGMDGPRIAANLPTPWVGVWERINVGVFLLWVVVLAVALLRGRGDPQRAR